MHPTSEHELDYCSNDPRAYTPHFLTHDPDGYYIDYGPGENQVTLRNVRDGISNPFFFDKNAGAKWFYPKLIKAALSMSKEAAQKRQHEQKLEQEIKILKEQLALARQNQFGTSSEQQSAQENVVPVDTQQLELPAKPKAPKLRLVSNAGRKPLPPHLPREEIEHTLPESDRLCSCCNSTMCKVGDEVTERVKYIPARFAVEKHISAKYVCRKCDRFVTAPVPKSMIPGSSYGTPEFLAQIACSKYQFGLPIIMAAPIHLASGSITAAPAPIMESPGNKEPEVMLIRITYLPERVGYTIPYLDYSVLVVDFQDGWKVGRN